MAVDDNYFTELEKLLSIPCSNPAVKNIFKETSSEIILEASSLYECALKVGHFWASIGKVRDEDDAVLCKLLDLESNSTFSYHIKLCLGNVKASLVEQNFESFPTTDEATIPTNAQRIRRQNGGEPSVGERDQIDDALRLYFGYSEFRPLQRETIIETMSGKDVIAILGTGGGKSLMFMLPALLASKPTVVVSPTKSLIDDMADRAKELNIPACKYTSEVDIQAREDQTINLLQYKLIFCTPELLHFYLNETIKTLDDNNDIERIVFDEAHTISSWGTTFRQVCKDAFERVADYKCPKLLLSATVSGRVLNEFRHSLPNLIVLRQPIFRENLTLEAKERGPNNKFFKDLTEFILDRKGMCGIIYCVTASDVGKVHGELRKNNIDCVKYHSKLADEVKRVSFEKWMSGDSNVLVANSSFGMGIDKANVRYVVHARIPTSVEEYYQQCGRAGRDGESALCRIYYNYSDKSVLYKLFQSQTDNFESQRQSLIDLIVMLEDTVHCRHQMIMKFFGEDREYFHCVSSCDNCTIRGQFHITDGTADALNVIQTIVELGNAKFNCNTLKLILNGSRQKSVLDHGYDTLASFGCLKNQFTSVQLLEKFLHRLIWAKIIGENIVQVNGKNTAVYLKLGEEAHNVLASRLNVNKIKKS